MSALGARGDSVPLPTSAWRAGLRRLDARAVLGWLVAPVVIMLVAWQPVGLVPIGGVDPSWMAGIAMAVHHGIPFGHDVIFTYGPLGFLSSTIMWYGSLGILSFAYLLVIRFGLALAVFASARRSFGAVGGFVIAAVVASVANQLNEESAIALILMVTALNRDLSRRNTLLLAALAGAVSGLEFLNKASLGLTLIAMTLVFALSLRGRRRELLASAGGAMVVAFLLFWLGLGEPLSALPAYLKNSDQIVSGYASAMGASLNAHAWQPVAALFALALGLGACLHLTAEFDRRRRIGVALLWVVFWFFSFKEGFVRNDAGHVTSFFDALLAGFFAFSWRGRWRLVALAATAALVAAPLAAAGESLTSRLTPVANAHAALDDVRAVASPARRAATLAAGRADIQTVDPVDAASLRLLAGHTVTVYPSEIAIAWAYGLHWVPMPVLQSYSAYTASLDRLDAGFLSSARAPERMLVTGPPTTLDGRVLSFDQPLTSRTILCRYTPLRTTASVAVLGLGADRCGAPRPLATVQAGWGQSVPVPAPPDANSLVFVRISGIQVGGLESVRQLLFKPAERSVALNGGPSRRLVPATALDGLPLRASAGVDFPSPYNVAVGATSIAVGKDGQPPTAGRAVTYSFYSEPVRRRS